jgi:phospholipid/cholesterol/gamma-HCH transport system substrate-binding protein
MLTVGTRIKIIAFVLISITVVVYVGLRYADLGRLVGLRGYYVVKVDLSDGGGIFPNAEVTYRGVPVGRVGAVDLTASGVQADLDIDTSAAPIPSSAEAVVADRSAVGEQYVDLRPKTDKAPYLADGATIAQRNTQLPPPVQNVLGDVDKLADSVPTKSLQTVVDELYTATQDQGPNLQTLLDTGSRLTTAAIDDVPHTSQLIDDGRTVLRTQAGERDALRTFGTDAALLAAQLDSSDTDLRRLIANAPPAVDQVAGVLRDTNPTLSTLFANLLTTSELTLTRQDGLSELLSVAPATIAAGSTVINQNGARIGMALTFFDPLPCTAGYATTYRNGLDTSASRALNTAARCTMPAGSGVEVRGSANAPSGGGVPTAASAGTFALAGPVQGSAATRGAALPGALGLPALPPGPTGMDGLLGLGAR